VRVDLPDEYVNDFVMATLMAEDSEAEVFASEDALSMALAEVTDARHAHAELLANTKLVTILGMEEYTTLLENSKARVEMSEIVLAQAQVASDLVSVNGSMRDVYPTLEVEEQKQILKGWLDAVTVSRGTGELEKRVSVVGLGNVLLSSPVTLDTVGDEAPSLGALGPA
jgi:hypothetical protein